MSLKISSDATEYTRDQSLKIEQKIFLKIIHRDYLTPCFTLYFEIDNYKYYKQSYFREDTEAILK